MPISVQDVAALFTVKGRTTWRGHEYRYGPCPLCGGEDRAGYYETEDSKGIPRVRWYCRRCDEEHPKRADPRFWHGDFLIYLKTGQWPDKDYKFDPNQKSFSYSRPKIQPPLFSDLDEKHPQNITLREVELYARNSGPALKYFGEYKISQKTLERHVIGYGTNVPHCAIPGGYTIPTISLGANGVKMLRALQIRRDEAACLAELLKRSPQWRDAKRNDLLDKWLKEIEEGRREMELRNPTDADLVEYIWPKYSSVSGSQPGVWGDDLVSLPGGERIGPSLPYIFVTEDAKSAMVLRQDGYPAVAYKHRHDWDAHLGTVFKRIPTVYVVADRDEKSNNMGAGMNTAVKVRENIVAGGAKNVKIFMPPQPFNDVADLVRADGFEAMRGWIDEKCPQLEPVMERDEANGEI